MTKKQEKESILPFIFFGVIVFALIGLSMSITIVGAGERGVLLEWGAVTGIIWDEGLHFKVPIKESVDIMNVKTLKLETTASSASKDLQMVTSSIALNYRVKPDKTAWIRQNIGKDYRIKIVEPSIQEAVKSATAQFTAEELITKRPIVREQMKIALEEKLNILTLNSINVDEFHIVNFKFSKQFDMAIELKVTAEQQALKAERDLDRIKIEKEQIIATAQAEAESIRIQSQALNENPDILQLRWIEKWDGHLPTTLMDGANSGVLLNVANTKN